MTPEACPALENRLVPCPLRAKPFEDPAIVLSGEKSAHDSRPPGIVLPARRNLPGGCFCLSGGRSLKGTGKISIILPLIPKSRVGMLIFVTEVYLVAERTELWLRF